MTTKLRPSCSALLAIVLIAACSDSTTRPGDNLSAEQVQSMTTALSFLFGVSLGSPEANRTSPPHFDARRAMAEALPIARSTACPLGGHVGVDGTFSVDTGGDGIFALTDTLVECAIKDDHSNVWTFNSKPTVAVTLAELTSLHGDSIDLAHSTLIQTDTGTVRYSTGNLSGSCPLALSIRFDVTTGAPTADSATISLSTVGTVCGHEVTRDTSAAVPFTPPQL